MAQMSQAGMPEDYAARILNRTVKRALLVLLVAFASLALVGGAGGASSQPRVLAITFGPDLEINPVTQSYLTSDLSRAARNHYGAAVILLRAKRPEAHRPFKCPAVFVLAPIGILFNVTMMLFLPIETWWRLLIWLGIGLVLYFCYGYWNSSLGKRLAGQQA